MQSNILSTLFLLTALSLGANAVSSLAGTPVAVAAMPTPTPGSLTTDVLNLFNSLAANPAVASLGEAFINGIETDALNFALASPSAALSDIPGLFSILNAVVASESYLPTLTAVEGVLLGSLTAIVAADATKPAALASDVANLVGGIAANSVVGNLFASIGNSIETDAEAFAIASPSAVLADLSLLVSDVNPMIAMETFAPAFSTLEAAVQGALATIVSHDVPAITTGPTAGVSTFSTKGMNGTKTGAATASQTISTFKGAAGTTAVGTVGLLAAVGLAVVVLL
ncbi:hypothetical protein MMC11_008774 [Xylographa trunciseda]|nr:hypothetical protein [Xylographa trunciseda]